MKKAIGPSRHQDLQRLLERRRLDIQNDVHDRMRAVRGRGAASARRTGLDGLEVGMQEDLELDLIQIHAEMADKITEALGRVDEGHYGRCNECGQDIAEKRLRALPFATRCKQCQEAFETKRRRDRHLERCPPMFSADVPLNSDDR